MGKPAENWQKTIQKTRVFGGLHLGFPIDFPNQTNGCAPPTRSPLSPPSSSWKHSRLLVKQPVGVVMVGIIGGDW